MPHTHVPPHPTPTWHTPVMTHARKGAGRPLDPHTPHPRATRPDPTPLPKPEVAEKEGVTSTGAGLEAIVFTADGDMRQARHWGGGWLGAVRVSVRVRVCACVFVRVSVCVCLCERERV